MSTASVVRWTCDVLHCGATAEVVDQGQTPLGWLDCVVREPVCGLQPYTYTETRVAFCPAHGAEVRSASALRKDDAIPAPRAAAGDEEVPRLVLLVKYVGERQEVIKMTVEAGCTFHIIGPCNIRFAPVPRDLRTMAATGDELPRPRTNARLSESVPT